MLKAVLIALVLSLSVSAAGSRKLNGTYKATAYAQTGTTKSGEWTHRHVVAADPELLPIGTRIKIRRAGKYSGEYVVADTGSMIQGRHLDIYMPNEAACKAFGVKAVKVQVVELGAGTRASVKESDVEIKQNIANDLKQKAVGNSATQEDWAKSKAAKTAAQQAASEPAAPATLTPVPPK